MVFAGVFGLALAAYVVKFDWLSELFAEPASAKAGDLPCTKI